MNGSIHVNDRGPTPSSGQNGSTGFPKYLHKDLNTDDSAIEDELPGSPAPGPLPDFSQLHSGERWQARKSSDNRGRALNSVRGTRPGRQKSLSEALATVRTRRASVTQNAVEIAEALRPPVSVKLVVSTGQVVCGFTDSFVYRCCVCSGTSHPLSPTHPPKQSLRPSRNPSPLPSSSSSSFAHCVLLHLQLQEYTPPCEQRRLFLNMESGDQIERSLLQPCH